MSCEIKEFEDTKSLDYFSIDGKKYYIIGGFGNYYGGHLVLVCEDDYEKITNMVNEYKTHNSYGLHCWEIYE